MEKEKILNIPVANMKENFLMGKEMEKEKNIIIITN